MSRSPELARDIAIFNGSFAEAPYGARELMVQPALPSEYVPFPNRVRRGVENSKKYIKNGLSEEAMGALILLSSGYNHPAISRELGVKKRKVDYMLPGTSKKEGIYKKLDVLDVVGAIKWCIQHECILPQEIVPPDYERGQALLALREQDVLNEAVRLGTRNSKLLGKNLGITESTVNTFLLRVKDKFGAVTPTHAIIMYLAYSLLPPEIKQQYSFAQEKRIPPKIKQKHKSIPAGHDNRAEAKPIKDDQAAGSEQSDYVWQPKEEVEEAVIQNCLRQMLSHGMGIIACRYRVEGEEDIFDKPQVITSAEDEEQLLLIMKRQSPRIMKIYNDATEEARVSGIPQVYIKDSTQIGFLFIDFSDRALQVPLDQIAKKAANELLNIHFLQKSEPMDIPDRSLRRLERFV